MLISSSYGVLILGITVCLIVDVKKKWENSSWGRKLIVQKRRASLNDFDRFKIMLAKIKVSVIIFMPFPTCFDDRCTHSLVYF